jgi:hypothetical protein
MAAVSYYQTANTAPECRAEDVRVFDSDAGPCLAWSPTPWEKCFEQRRYRHLAKIIRWLWLLVV